MGIRESPGVLNDYVYRDLLPEEDDLFSIARLVEFGFVEEEVADLYSEDRGRPSYPPVVLLKMLFLDHYTKPLRCEGEQPVPLQPPLPGLCGVGSKSPHTP